MLYRENGNENQQFLFSLFRRGRGKFSQWVNKIPWVFANISILRPTDCVKHVCPSGIVVHSKRAFDQIWSVDMFIVSRNLLQFVSHFWQQQKKTLYRNFKIPFVLTSLKNYSPFGSYKSSFCVSIQSPPGLDCYDKKKDG